MHSVSSTHSYMSFTTPYSRYYLYVMYILATTSLFRPFDATYLLTILPLFVNELIVYPIVKPNI
jgi:hypothetical protein